MKEIERERKKRMTERDKDRESVRKNERDWEKKRCQKEI